MRIPACFQKPVNDNSHYNLLKPFWTVFNLAIFSRLTYLPELLSQVRLPMISDQALSAELDKVHDPVLKLEVSRIIDENKEHAKGPPPLRSSPVDICENYLKFCDYDFWLQKQNLPRKNSRKYVLVIGGFSASRGPGQ